MNCIICREEFSNINKICICRDSYVCNNCLILANNNNMNRCPVCRKNLNYTYYRDYSQYTKIIIKPIFANIATIIIPLIYPIYDLYNNITKTDLFYILPITFFQYL